MGQFRGRKLEIDGVWRAFAFKDLRMGDSFIVAGTSGTDCLYMTAGDFIVKPRESRNEAATSDDSAWLGAAFRFVRQEMAA